MNRKIVFFGTTDFAAESLKELAKEFEVVAVVTAPDKKRGRGLKVSYTPVKEASLDLNLATIQPENLRKNPELLAKLKSFEVDLFVVVAYRILPKKIIEIPKLGSINLHASLLPKYRGASPINYALFQGEKFTGLTVFFLNKEIDGGDIVASKQVEIAENDNFTGLYAKLMKEGASFLPATVKKIFSNDYFLKKQTLDDENIYAPKLLAEDFVLDFGKSAEEINNRIRGLSFKPGAYTVFRSKRLKILEARAEKDSTLFEGKKEGEIVVSSKKELKIKCGNGILNLISVQPQGKVKMEISAFINGYSPKLAEILG